VVAPVRLRLRTTDANNELTRVRSELDNVDSDRKLMKAKLEAKEKLVDDLSARLSALEKGEQIGDTVTARHRTELVTANPKAGS